MVEDYYHDDEAYSRTEETKHKKKVDRRRYRHVIFWKRVVELNYEAFFQTSHRLRMVMSPGMPLALSIATGRRGVLAGD